MAAYGGSYNRVGYYERVQGVESPGDLITTIRRDVTGRYIEIWNNSEEGAEFGITEDTKDPKSRKVFYLGPGKGIHLIVNSAGGEAQFLMIRTLPKGVWTTIGVLTLTANHYEVVKGLDSWWIMPYYSSSRLH